MNSETWSAFRPDLRGRFVDRPNRFVVRVNLGGTIVEAHCPNPGRISELLFPGSEVILERAPGDRKLGYTLVAVERPGPEGIPVTVPLASVRANSAVAALILPRMFPGARSVKAEYALEGSRFDFAVEDAAGVRHLVEVKACSEVEYGSALFPDAPSARARKHLEELAVWGDRGWVPHVIFAVVHGRPTTFGPNIHTDPEFSQTLAALASQIHLHAVVLETGPDGQTRVVEPNLPIAWAGADGPDAGHLVRLEPEGPRWRVQVEWVPAGWAKAVAKAPARRTFSIRDTVSRVHEYRAGLREVGGTGESGEPLVFDEDPRTKPEFVDRIMAWRHRGR